MRKPFLIGFAVIMLITVAFLIIKGNLSDISPSVSPSIPPSPLSSSPKATSILPPLGGDDRIIASGNIEKILAIGNDSVEPLKKLCKSGKMLERHDALIALYRVSSRDSTPIALSLLDDPEPEIQIVALTICAKMRKTEAIDKVVGLLSSPDSQVRARAVKALAFLREKQALGQVTQMLKDSAAIVRESAAMSIEAITFESFNLPHSGFQSQQEESLKQLNNWIAINSRFTRYQWLEQKILRSITKLVDNDPWARYDANTFLVKIFGDTGFFWDQPLQKRKEISENLKKKWQEYIPLFKVNLPVYLNMELQ